MQKRLLNCSSVDESYPFLALWHSRLEKRLRYEDPRVQNQQIDRMCSPVLQVVGTSLHPLAIMLHPYSFSSFPSPWSSPVIHVFHNRCGQIRGNYISHFVPSKRFFCTFFLSEPSRFPECSYRILSKKDNAKKGIDLKKKHDLNVQKLSPLFLEVYRDFQICGYRTEIKTTSKIILIFQLQYCLLELVFSRQAIYKIAVQWVQSTKQDLRLSQCHIINTLQ